MKLTHRLLENSVVYRLWQRPFVEQKVAPLLRRGEIERARRVLDVGCGPGTNTRHFATADYLGVDINPHYIAAATRQYGRQFVVADVTQYSAAGQGKFDLILVNSMLHHIDPAGVRRLLSHLSTLLSDDGHIHVLDMVVPAKRLSIPRLLTRMDRGEYPRPLADLRALVEEFFQIVAIEPYPLTAAGVTLWEFVYLKAHAQQK